jgi:HAD superfamily hydrolase (TIGR01490 family)
MSAVAAAFFDVDGTIVEGNIVRYYARLRTSDMPRALGALWIAAFALRVPWYLVLDKCSRARFQRALYRNYVGISPADLEKRAEAHFREHLQPHLFPAALERIEEHRRQQHLVVLVTGSLRPIVEPVATCVHATELLAPRLVERDGAFTGELAGVPLAGQAKADAVSDFVRRHGLDPMSCHAYADSLDDAPLLDRVGHAAAVNPGPQLAKLARERGWEILRWSAR